MRRLNVRQAALRQKKRAIPAGTRKLIVTICGWFVLTGLILTWGNTYLGALLWVACYFGLSNWLLGGTPFREVNHLEWLTTYWNNNVIGWTEVFWLGPRGYGRSLWQSRRQLRIRSADYTIIVIPLGGWKNKPSGQTVSGQSSRWRVEIPPDCFADYVPYQPEARLPEVYLVDRQDRTVRHRLPIDRALDYLSGAQSSFGKKYA